MVAVTERRRRLPIEPSDETTCGDEDLTRHVPGRVACQEGVCRGDVFRRGRVECGLGAHLVEQAAAVQSRDVTLVVRAGGQPRLAPGQTTFARTPCSFHSAAMASVRPLTPPLPAG